ncbi:MAG: aspartate-semialdehyde dehydrogenase [Steroidobacterales bacterium]
MSAPVKPLRVAVVGASSLIGEALIEMLRTRKFPLSTLHALDDARDLGRTPSDGERDLVALDVATFDFARVDLAFFCARSAVAARYAEAAAAHAWVIDGSLAHREREDVPLVIADVNPESLAGVGRQGLIALPGSATTALATVLAPLHAAAGLTRVEVVTCQAVSGSGRAAMEGLAAETVDMLSGRKAKGRIFGRQIAFNVIPQVDALDDDGVSAEERRLLHETRRVLGLPHLALNATAIRVPVFFGHSLAVHASFVRDLGVDAATKLLQSSKGISLAGPGSPGDLPTPALEGATSPDLVHVGRLRADLTRDRSLNFWLVADNVRKCAACNAFSVADILVNSPV